MATISDVQITGSGGNGGNEYVTSPLKTTLNNPSELSLIAGTITLPTFYQGVQVGESVVQAFDLVPGSNTMNAEFRYHPADANDTVAQSFLQTVRAFDSLNVILTRLCSIYNKVAMFLSRYMGMRKALLLSP